jgi:hypothetical protein
MTLDYCNSRARTAETPANPAKARSNGKRGEARSPTSSRRGSPPVQGRGPHRTAPIGSARRLLGSLLPGRLRWTTHASSVLTNGVLRLRSPADPSSPVKQRTTRGDSAGCSAYSQSFRRGDRRVDVGGVLASDYGFAALDAECCFTLRALWRRRGHPSDCQSAPVHVSCSPCATPKLTPMCGWLRAG